MKIFASLFFCALLFFCNSTYSQQEKDSLDYYIDLIKNPKNISDYTKAFIYLKKDKEISLAKKDTSRVIYELNYISRVQYKLGAYYDSENSAIEALEFIDESGNRLYKASILNRLGIIKRTFKDYTASLRYYSQIINFSNIDREKGIAYNNLGVVYEFLNNYDSALVAYKKAYNLNLKTNNKKEMLRSLDNLGYIQSKLNTKVGLDNMFKALEIRKKIEDYDIYTSYKNLSVYYKDKDEIKKSLLYAKKGYQSAIQFNSLPYLEDALSNLISLGEDQYAQAYMKVKEDIKIKELNKNNNYAEANYNYTKVENERKKAEDRRKRAEVIALEEQTKASRNLFIALSILLMAVFVYYILKSRHKKEKLKERYDTERHISKRLHDEVANDVFSIMSRMQNDITIKKEFIDEFEEVYMKVRNISKANAAIDVSKDFDVLLKDLMASYKTEDVNIFTRNISEISWDSIATRKKETLYRVLQELMTNMRKHSKATLVNVQFEKKKHKTFVMYVDNGIGCKLKYGNGLYNTESRMKMAECSITFESETNKGFQAKLII